MAADPATATIVHGTDRDLVCVRGREGTTLAREAGIVLRLKTADGRLLEQVVEDGGHSPLPAAIDLDPAWNGATGDLHVEIGVCVEDDQDCVPMSFDLRYGPGGARGECR